MKTIEDARILGDATLMNDTRPQAKPTMVGLVLGNYRVTGALSAGGMGSVYRAQHAMLGRSAAIKVLRPELTANEELLQRFFNEAKAATTIRHPGIVEVYDFGYTEDGRAYIVMELLDGEPLSARIERRGQLTEVETEDLGRQLAGALRAAHTSGIVHRDLKPENIFLVTEPNGRGTRAKILDFGVAKLASPTSERHTQTGALMGTPQYMAPEQARAAGTIDHRADLYSLGCILYEMLVGRPPFVADGAGEIIALQLFAPPEPPSKLMSALTPALEAIVLRLLEKEPQDRYQQALEVGEALQAIQSGLSSQLAVVSERESKRFTLSNAAAPTDRITAPIQPTPRPSGENALRLGLLDGPPQLAGDSRSAMPIIAGLVTVALAAAGGMFVLTRGGDEPAARPAPVAPPAPVATPTAPPPAKAEVTTPPGPTPMFVVADEPVERRPKKVRPKADSPKAPDQGGLVTTPGKDKPCVSPDGSPCEYDIGELSRPAVKAP